MSPSSGQIAGPVFRAKRPASASAIWRAAARGSVPARPRQRGGVEQRKPRHARAGASRRILEGDVAAHRMPGQRERGGRPTRGSCGARSHSCWMRRYGARTVDRTESPQGRDLRGVETRRRNEAGNEDDWFGGHRGLEQRSRSMSKGKRRPRYACAGRRISIRAGYCGRHRRCARTQCGARDGPRDEWRDERAARKRAIRLRPRSRTR